MTDLLLFNVTNGLIIGAFYVLMALGLSLILNSERRDQLSPMAAFSPSAATSPTRSPRSSASGRRC